MKKPSGHLSLRALVGVGDCWHQHLVTTLKKSPEKMSASVPGGCRWKTFQLVFLSGWLQASGRCTSNSHSSSPLITRILGFFQPADVSGTGERMLFQFYTVNIRHLHAPLRGWLLSTKPQHIFCYPPFSWEKKMSFQAVNAPRKSPSFNHKCAWTPKVGKDATHTAYAKWLETFHRLFPTNVIITILLMWY